MLENAEYERVQKEIERATKSASDLVAAYLAVHRADDGRLVRDIGTLPAKKEDIRKAIVVVACVSDSAPNVQEIGETLITAWCALEFYDPVGPGVDEASILAHPKHRSYYRSELAGNPQAARRIEQALAEHASRLDPDAALAWFKSVQADYKARLSSADHRIESLRFFAGDSVPDEVFRMMRAAQSAPPAKPSSAGCLSAMLFMLVPIAIACRYLTS